MELCLSIEIQEGMSYAQTLAMTRAGEELGCHSALLAEHYYPSGRPERYAGGLGERNAADAWIYLAGLSRETSRIRLGTLVSPVTFRHPVVLAKMAATLDHLSDGRAELGIGAGWLIPEHQSFGFDFAAPGRRVDLVEEQLQVITGLWSQDPFSHEGRAYHLSEAHFTPKPVQKPRPTIIVGGRTTSERMPRLAARYADEFVIGSPSPEQCRQAREKLDRACAANGRDPAEVRLSAFLSICVGQTQADVDRVLAEYEATNPQYVGMLDNRPNWIEGTPEQAKQKLAALEAAGVERALLSVNSDVHREMLPLLV
ncbi:MAG: LLM class flavin-dependent oxidoreductase [Chloroflexi bacterium]|nr:LLM class flavin-dependent oxidoreductase [Chloroflexota bacterium]